jgi:ATP-dependent DNA helicase RecQ
LGIVKEKVIRIIGLLREEEILADTRDLTAFIRKGENSNRSLSIAESYGKLENFLASVIDEEKDDYPLKQINQQAIQFGLKDSTPLKLKTLINFWAIKNWVKKHFQEGSKYHVQINLNTPKNELTSKIQKRHELCRMITEYLYQKTIGLKIDEIKEDILIEFSVHELKQMIDSKKGLFNITATIDDIEDTLFYLSRIESIKIEGGFLVVHNRLTIDRLEKNNRIQYKRTMRN